MLHCSPSPSWPLRPSSPSRRPSPHDSPSRLTRRPTVPTPSVSVTGTGKVIVKPTIARISFGVFTHNETANAAQTANDAIMAKITAALKAAGIKEEDIQTTGYSLQPRWVWDKTNEKNIQDGYDMNHSMVVTVRAIKDAGKIVSLVADNGANTVDGISFDVDDATLEQTRLTALDLAMVNARKRADVVAKAAGRTILSVQTVNVNENSYTPVPDVQQGSRHDSRCRKRGSPSRSRDPRHPDQRQRHLPVLESANIRPEHNPRPVRGFCIAWERTRNHGATSPTTGTLTAPRYVLAVNMKRDLPNEGRHTF